MLRVNNMGAGIAGALLFGALLVAPRGASAQPFSFAPPWDDSSATEIDLSALNGGPAGANGPVRVSGGHFVDGSGQRIRFVGVQLIAPDCFPTHAEADAFAAHLAKYGINMVRFHYIDEMSHNGTNADGNVWNWNPGHRGELDLSPSGRMDRLDYFFAQLKSRGIYVDINLKAGRLFQNEDTGNSETNSISFSPNFRVDYFDRTMIDLQKQYVNRLLSHVNPYTGVAYKNEPAVLSYELNNENALSLDWGGITGIGLLSMPPSYVTELKGMWNAWLKNKYGTTTNLLNAWKAKESVTEDADLLGPIEGGTWNRSYNANASTAYTTINPLALKADVRTTDGYWNSSQLIKDKLNLSNGTSYTLRFRIKGSRPSMSFFIANNGTGGNYNGVGLAGGVNPTSDWKNYTYTFTATGALANNVNLSFVLGDFTGDVYFTGLSLRANGTGPELLPALTDTSATGWNRLQGPQAVTTYTNSGTALNASIATTNGDWLASRLLRSGVTLANNQKYILRYSAKSDRTTTPVSLTDAGHSYQGVGATTPTILPSTDWQDFTIPFTTGSLNTTNGEMSFVLGEHTGNLTLAEVSLKKQNTTPNPELLNTPGTLGNWLVDNSVGGSATTVGSEFKLSNTTAGNYDNFQIHQDGRTLVNGHTYTLRFRIRGTHTAPILVMCNNHSTWVSMLWQNLALPGTATDYAITFNAHDAQPALTRVGFAMGNSTGDTYISNISLKEGYADATLPAGESLEANGGLGNISLIDTPTAERKNDWVHFIADLEVGYAKEMRDYVKSLAPNTMVTCSQIGFGGLIGLYRERGMDYVDNHSYWDLPGPGGGVTNVSMVHYMNSMSNALAGLAKGRVAGKPYTISEYNHAWPNEYQAECMPLIGSIAGVQDWDMVNFHAYGPYASRAASGGAYGFGSDKISDNFDVGHNPAKIGFMPAMALMLRKGLIAPASGVDTHTLPANINNVDFVNMGPTATWTSHGDTGTVATDLFTKRWEVSFGGGQSSTPTGAGSATVNVAGITSSKQSGIFTTNSDGAKVVTGFVGGQTVNVGNASFGFNSGIPNNFAALTLTAMDGTSINTANKSLLTLASRAQNSGQTWNGVALDGNGNPIVDPVTGENFHLLGSIGGNQQVEIPQVHVVMPADSAREVHALNSTGGFGGIIPSTYNSTNHTLTFDIYPGYSTMWFTINKMPPVGMKVSGKDS